jgi:hypothetical protein
MQLPSSIVGLVVWVIALVVAAIIAVFLFEHILLPILKQVT